MEEEKVYLDVTVLDSKKGMYHIAFGENTSIKTAVQILEEEGSPVVDIGFAFAKNSKSLFLNKSIKKTKSNKSIGKGMMAFFD